MQIAYVVHALWVANNHVQQVGIRKYMNVVPLGSPPQTFYYKQKVIGSTCLEKGCIWPLHD